MAAFGSQGGLPVTHTISPGRGASPARRVCLEAGRVSDASLSCCSDSPSSAGFSSIPLGTGKKAFRLCSLHLKRLTGFPVALPCSSANATPEFEGRGGDDLGTEIANTLYRIFNNKSSVDLKSLCISPREHCWILYVDVLVSVTWPNWPCSISPGTGWPTFHSVLFFSSSGYF